MHTEPSKKRRQHTTVKNSEASESASQDGTSTPATPLPGVDQCMVTFPVLLNYVFV